MKLTQFLYITTLVSYAGLFILLMLWYIILAPSESIPRSLVLLFFIGPLLLPLRGLLDGRPYTYAWSSFLIMIYFIHGVIEAYASTETRIYALLEIFFSCALFFSLVYYARLRSRELKTLNQA